MTYRVGVKGRYAAALTALLLAVSGCGVASSASPESTSAVPIVTPDATSLGDTQSATSAASATASTVSTASASPTPTGTTGPSGGSGVTRPGATRPAAPGSSAPAGGAATDAQAPSGILQIVDVTDVASLEQAMTSATAGTLINLAPGSYVRSGGRRWNATADGTADHPIVLRGPRSAVLASDGPAGDYALFITGDHWHIEALSIANASTGIAVEGATGIQVTEVDIGRIGEEGVHFRRCAKDAVVSRSVIHDTGLTQPGYGEGVYVGSAQGHWGTYGCSGGIDRTTRIVVQGNTFRNVTAEGVDVKEGTDAGVIRGNDFDGTGFSGVTYADSAIELKGRGWTVDGNRIRNPRGANVDGIQVFRVVDGWGGGNTLRNNRVEGAWPGFGIRLSPSLDNVAACSNAAPSAVKGLLAQFNAAIPCR